MLTFSPSAQSSKLRQTALHLVLAAVVTSVFALSAFAAAPQADSDDQNDNKNVDIRTPVGDAHIGTDADARKIGLPVYPGARIRKSKDKDNNSANFGIFTSAFGIKLLVADYDSDETPGKLVAYYREKLKKYGPVLECHTSKHGLHMDAGDGDSDSSTSDTSRSTDKSLKCGGDNTGDDIELKVGTEDNQHIVAIESGESGKGSSFALVYVHMRGKQADI